jgi:hypothetical protein
LGSPRFGAALACFQACGPLLFSPSYRLSQKFPSASHPSVRQLLLGAPSLRSTPLAGLSTRAAPIRGFGPPHDITNSHPFGAASLSRYFSNVEISQIPTPFRPQALSASRRFSPQVGLQAYFIPQPCSGPILFRGSFSSRSRTISSIAELFPPCR